jgi:hypothetical protein
VDDVMRRSALATFAAGDAAGDAAGLGLADRPVGRVTATVSSAGLRALAAAAAGFALTAGLSLVLWALSPSSGSDAGEALRGGAVAFAAAHFLPVTISGTALTLRPLLLTGVVIAVMMTAVGHARSVRGRALEAVHAGVFTVVYGAGVAALVTMAAPAGSARANLLAPATVAAVGAVLSLVQGATDWRSWWAATVPEWVRRSLRAAMTTVLALISTSAAVLAIALAVSIPDALEVAQLTVHSVGDAIGVVLLCLAFLPNAVIATIGYVSGAGFSIGAAGYSPLAVHTADLPAVPLLAAVPEAHPGVAAWATLLAPILAASIGAWTLRRVGVSRLQRLAVLCSTALIVGAVTAGLAAVGGGGVGGGAWTEMGADPLTAGGLIAGMVLLVTASLVVPTGWASLAWRSGYDAASGIGGDDGTADDGPVGGGSVGDAAALPVADGAAPAGNSVMPDGKTSGNGQAATEDAAVHAQSEASQDASAVDAVMLDGDPGQTEQAAEIDRAESEQSGAEQSGAEQSETDQAETGASDTDSTGVTPEAPEAPRDTQPDDPLAEATSRDSDPGDTDETGGALQQAG